MPSNTLLTQFNKSKKSLIILREEKAQGGLCKVQGFEDVCGVLFQKKEALLEADLQAMK